MMERTVMHRKRLPTSHVGRDTGKEEAMATQLFVFCLRYWGSGHLYDLSPKWSSVPFWPLSSLCVMANQVDSDNSALCGNVSSTAICCARWAGCDDTQWSLQPGTTQALLDSLCWPLWLLWYSVWPKAHTCSVGVSRFIPVAAFDSTTVLCFWGDYFNL